MLVSQIRTNRNVDRRIGGLETDRAEVLKDFEVDRRTGGLETVL